jgi:hypothetical protein
VQSELAGNPTDPKKIKTDVVQPTILPQIFADRIEFLDAPRLMGGSEFYYHSFSRTESSSIQ